MKNHWKTCATLAVVLSPIPGDERKVKTEWFSRTMATLELVWMFLNGDRKEIVDAGGVPVKRLAKKVELNPYVGQPDCWEVERAIQGIGGVPAYYGKCILTNSESMRVMSSYSGLQVSPIHEGATKVLPQDVRYIERINHDMAFGVNPVRCYGFLPTKQQLDRQINVIDSKMKLSDDNSDTCSDALVNAFYNVLGGYDTIYMAENLETM